MGCAGQRLAMRPQRQGVGRPAACCCAGPLLQRATSLVFEGVPTYPTPSRCWEVVDKWQASADAAAI